MDVTPQMRQSGADVIQELRDVIDSEALAERVYSAMAAVASKDVGAYVGALINTPWTRDGRHCWQLVIEVERDLFGRALPLFLDAAPKGGEGRKIKARLFTDHEEAARWAKVDEPAHGAVALLRRSAAPPGFYIHAGVYLSLDGGGVLHSDDPHGVVFDSLLELSARGWVADYFLPKVTNT